MIETFLAGLVLSAASVAPPQCETDAILPDDITSSSRMGTQIAVGGNSLAVVDPFFTNGVTGTPNVSIYRRAGNAWVFDGSVSSTASSFGSSVAIADDVMFVGTPIAQHPWITGGHVDRFERGPTGWQFVESWQADPPTSHDKFGESLALDHGTLLIGAPYQESFVGGGFKGAVYVHTESGGTWPRVQRITDGSQTLRLGFSAAIDGDWAAVGARPVQNSSIGNVQMLERVSAGWTLGQSFQANATYSNFAGTLDLVGDLLVLGESRVTTQGEPFAGAVHVVRHTAQGWAAEASLHHPTPMAEDEFGSGVAIVGGRVVVGTPFFDPVAPSSWRIVPGSLEIFRHDPGSGSGGPAGDWVHERSVMSTLGTGTDALGRSVASSGNLLVAGTPYREFFGFTRGGASTFWFGGAQGTVVCDSSPNSTGDRAALFVVGDRQVAQNDVILAASGLPTGSFAFAIVSDQQGFVLQPGGSQGILCLGGSIGRYVHQVRQADPLGRVFIDVDLASIPRPTGLVPTAPGDTWFFQVWYRDANPHVTANLTDAVSVVFE